MKAFKGLLKKDWRMTQNWFIGVIMVVIVGLLAGYSFISYNHEPVAYFPITFLLFTVAFSYTPVMLISQLNIESRTQMWLYSEQPTILLILSKIAVLCIQSLLLFLMTSLYAYFAIYHWANHLVDNIAQLFFSKNISIIILVGIGWSIAVAANLFLLWAIYHALKEKVLSKRIRGVMIAIFVGVYLWLEDFIVSLAPIEQLMDTYLIDLTANFTMNYHNGWSVMFQGSPIPVLYITFYSLLTLLSIFIGSRLMQRRLEV